MTKTRVEVFTVQQISEKLGRPKSLIDTHLKREGIKPFMRVGNTRLFDEVAVEKISLSLSMKQSEN